VAKLVVGSIEKGLRTNRTAFVIDNDNFPELRNAFTWRGRVRRKRGTSLLGQLQRYFDSTSVAYTSTSVSLDSNGDANLVVAYSLPTASSLKIGSLVVTDTVSTTVYTDNGDGTLNPSGSINYATGALTIAASANNVIDCQFTYYPTLPVMGLETIQLNPTAFPTTLAFDTQKAYSISTSFPYPIENVSYFKNAPTALYPSYVEKTVDNSITWNGQDYQQVWSTNYEQALFTTYGITFPFSQTNVGMHYAPTTDISNATIASTTQITVQIANSPLVVGDFVFFNEWTGSAGAALNFQTGYITAVNTGTTPSTYTITFPYANIVGTHAAGIIQYLTNVSDNTKDCIRWYDGAPVVNNAFVASNGFVNYCPPLSFDVYPIGNLKADIYYLVSAQIIVPFKDRLLFFGCVVQTSTPGSQVYLPDTIIYTQNGTPYYTASFSGDVRLATTVPIPLLTPTDQNATATTCFCDIAGFGGFLTLGYGQKINTVASNEDVLILGLDNAQARLVYTGNDITPFAFYIINSEYGSNAAFSAINLDRGVLTTGRNGLILTSQVGAQRIDLEIPDQIFQLSLPNKGTQRITAQRDFINEYIYFSYVDNENSTPFNNQTLLYNYRDQTFALFDESYTCYGQFQRQTGLTWATIGQVYPTWGSWTDSWNAGSSTLLQPEVIAGNQQGFVCFRNDGTNESISLSVQNATSATLTCVNHCLNTNDYFVYVDQLNNTETISKVLSVIDDNTIVALGVNITNYIGGSFIKKMYVPFIQSKQFPMAWEMGRKTRIGTSMFLFSTTAYGQVTVNLYLSQDAANAANVQNDSCIYSTVVFTCPESTNLGLTQYTQNLQMPAAFGQSQIWHRVNTSLIGDTVQFAITLSDAQMLDPNQQFQFAEIEWHGAILDVNPSQMLC